MRHILLICALAGLLLPAVSRGQTLDLEPGRPIRVTAYRYGLKRTPVTFEALGADTLHVRYVHKRLDHGSVVIDSTRQPLPLDAVSQIEIPAGRRSNWDKGARTGAIMGGAVGLLLGGLYAACDDGFVCPQTPGQKVGGALAVTGTFGLGGGIVGALIGAMSTRERWQEVPMGGARIAIAPWTGGIAVTGSIAF
jgi:hypothetical protein